MEDPTVNQTEAPATPAAVVDEYLRLLMIPEPVSASRFVAPGLRIRFTPAVARWVASRGFRPECGARELRRVIQREIEPRLSDVLLSGEGSGDEVVVRARGGELRFDAA